MHCQRALFGIVILGALSGLAGAAPPPAPEASAARASPGIEDIYIFRSLRVERSAPDAFCDAAKIGFTAARLDRYVFKAVVTRAPDGKVVDARSHQSGTLRACFDGNPGDADVNFYAEGVLAGVAATGKGKCTNIASDYPEPGITSIRCFLKLSNLSPPYVAGVLTTNSIVSRQAIGEQSDPPGYTQPSIATIRLWRKR
jgi:hypothetical protein